MLHDLPGVPKKFLTLRGGSHTLVGAVENSDAEFRFQFLDGGSQAGLGDEKLLGSFTDGSLGGHGNDVFQLL